MRITSRISQEITGDQLLCGSKAAALSRLAQAGYLVPAGFCIHTAALQTLVVKTGITSVIEDMLRARDSCDREAAKAISREIRDLIEQQPVPEDIAAEIINRYYGLGRTLQCRNLDLTPVVVRPSPVPGSRTVRKGEQMLDAYLNVRGAFTLLEKIRCCWSSLWSESFVAGQARTKSPYEAPSLAVLVQMILNPRASGMLRSADQAGGAAGEFLVTASWGLMDTKHGQTGHCDHLIVDKSTGGILDEQIVLKQSRLILSRHTGAIVEDVPLELRDCPVLTPRQTAQLAALGSRIERIFQAPVEIEWALQDGRWYIIQAVAMPPTQSVQYAQNRTDLHTIGTPGHTQGAKMEL